MTASRLEGRLALSPAEAARALGVSERHLRGVLRELPHIHLGRRVVIPVDALRDWLRERSAAERSSTKRLADEILASLSE